MKSARRREPEEFFGRADPAAHGGIAIEMKAAFMRDARIGQQRYVGERDGVAGQKWRDGELVLHPRQRRIAALDLVGVEVGSRLAQIEHLEAADRDIGLMAVLLPEQPLVHLAFRERILRNETRTAREIADDGVGLRQRTAVVEFDRRHLAGAVELEEFRGARLALERIDRYPGVGQREMVAHPLHLQAIAGIGIAVDLHAPPPLTATVQQAAANLSTASGSAPPTRSEFVAETGLHRIDAGFDFAGEPEMFPLGTEEEARVQHDVDTDTSGEASDKMGIGVVCEAGGPPVVWKRGNGTDVLIVKVHIGPAIDVRLPQREA